MLKLGSATVVTEAMVRQSKLHCNVSRYLSSITHSHEFTRCSAQSYLLNHPEKKSINLLTLPTLTPTVTSVRHRTPNIKRPAIPSKTRAVVLDLTFERFKYPLEGLPPTETCIEAVKNSVAPLKEQDNPFVRILAKEFLAEVEAGPMVAVFHRHHCSAEDLFDMSVQIHRSNMKYLYHNIQVVKTAFKDTKYANLLQTYMSTCGTVVCYDTDIQKLLKLERRLPYLTLMCAAVEGRIMSLQQLRDAAALPPLPLMHATLVQTLSTQAQRLSQHLTHHQTELSGALSRYCDGSLADAGEVATYGTQSAEATDDTNSAAPAS